jgi:hypothetical protein
MHPTLLPLTTILLEDRGSQHTLDLGYNHPVSSKIFDKGKETTWLRRIPWDLWDF